MGYENIWTIRIRRGVSNINIFAYSRFMSTKKGILTLCHVYMFVL